MRGRRVSRIAASAEPSACDYPADRRHLRHDLLAHAGDARSRKCGGHPPVRGAGTAALGRLHRDLGTGKKDAIEILKLPADRIDVIYPGVAEEFFTVGRPEGQAAAKRHGLDKPYFLYAGMIEPRKNADRLLDAYRSICEPVRNEHELVGVGPLGWCSDATRDRLLAPEPGVRYLGYVSEDDLLGITAGATAFVFPSLYEGFGLPLVQAMACGVPSITSRSSSLGEVAGEGAMLVDPRSTDEIAAAMERLALSPSLREDLGQRGRLRAASFRWERTARRSLAFFHKIASC